MSIITLNTRSLPDSAVTTAKIAADAITDAKIADDVIGTEHLTAGEVDATALATNAVTTAKIADSAVTAVKTSGVTSDMFRNILINGDMSLAQRGTSITGISTNTYTLDRWITEGDDATITVSRDTSVPTGSDAQGFRTSLKVAVTSAISSVSAADEQKIGQRIEGQMLQTLKYGTSAAESATLSFWVRSNITGTYAIQFQDDDNDKVQTKTYTISSADTWEKKTVTIAANTSNTLDNDSSRSFRVLWWLTAGSNFTGDSSSSGAWTARSSNLDTIAYGHNVNVMSSTSNTFYMTGCQFEVGATASDFEFLPKDVNTTRCQRYFQKSYALDTTPGTATDNGVRWTGGSSENGSNISFLPNFMTTMRSSPTVTGYARDGTSGEGYYARNGASGNGTFNAHMYSQNSVSVYVGIGATWTLGTVAAHTTFDAEL